MRLVEYLSPGMIFRQSRVVRIAPVKDGVIRLVEEDGYDKM